MLPDGETPWGFNRGNGRSTPAIGRDGTACFGGRIPVPKPVTDLSASAGEWIGEIRLSWAPSADLARVEIWRSLHPGFDTAVLVGEALPGTFHFRDVTVEPGQNYHYWVRALNAAGVRTRRRSRRVDPCLQRHRTREARFSRYPGLAPTP